MSKLFPLFLAALLFASGAVFAEEQSTDPHGDETTQETVAHPPTTTPNRDPQSIEDSKRLEESIEDYFAPKKNAVGEKVFDSMPTYGTSLPRPGD